MIATSNRAADLTGLRVGRLTVLRRVESYVQADGRRRGRWLCRCDCGATVEVLAQNLVSKSGAPTKTRSCGCLRSDVQITRQHRTRGGENANAAKERAKRLQDSAGKPKRAKQDRTSGRPTLPWGEALRALDDLSIAMGYPTGGKK